MDARPRVAWELAIEDGAIVHIEMIASPETISALDLTLLDG